MLISINYICCSVHFYDLYLSLQVWNYFLHSCEFFKYWVEIVDMVIIILAVVTTVVNEVVLTDEKKHPNARYAK